MHTCFRAGRGVYFLCVHMVYVYMAKCSLMSRGVYYVRLRILFGENLWLLPLGPSTSQCSAMMRLLLPLVASISVLQSMPIFCLHGCGKELSVLRRLIGACADCDPRALAISRPQTLSSEIDEMSRMGATEHNKEGVKWPSPRRRLRVV